MPQNLFGVHGVTGLVVCVGEGGRVIHFEGDEYRREEHAGLTCCDLRSVWVRSPSDAWIVGDEGTVLRWNGQRWHAIVLAAKHDTLNCVWGYPGDGIWIGGARYLMKYHLDGSGTLIVTDYAVKAIWGSGPKDMFFLCSERKLMHWNGESAATYDLPGEDDEEWRAVAGTDDGVIYVVGLSGLVMRWDRSQWYELDSGTRAILTAAVGDGQGLWVTTETGQVRHLSGRRWATAAFSCFGALNAVCMVDGIVWAAGERGIVVQHQADDGAGKE